MVFAALRILAATSRAADPVAVSNPMNVTTGEASYSFRVVYTDDGEVDPYAINNDDVRVTGPAGFDVAAALVFKSSSIPSPLIYADYSITPPGGSWDSTDNGTYAVVMQANQVFDGLGNAVKAGTIGSFTVTAPDSTPRPASEAQLLNISTRMRVQTGENVLIGGFIITGTEPKKVIVRAIGPSLGNANPPVPGAMADPTMELHDGTGALLAMNDNWMDAPNMQEIIGSTVPPTNDLESAILMTLPANNAAYTAIVRGVNNTTGIALVEAYDLDQPAASQLANISTRGFVEAGSNVLIGGFILGNGTGTTNVLIRAIGPSLATANPPVAGALADPTLELHDANGALVMSNDNWKESQQAEIEATTIPPTNDLESALVATLPATAHTAIVAGKNGLTGVALVEVYRLP